MCVPLEFGNYLVNFVKILYNLLKIKELVLSLNCDLR
jgi:hypothetical protein